MPTCSSCGEENPDRARFCLSCGASLAAACPTCGEENPPGARFCGSCGAPLTATATTSAPTPRELRKTVTVVFCDVTGSTTIGEKIDPESLRRVMSRYFDEMRAALERHGGTVEKFIGDAVVAVFGIPAVHEDDALRAVRAAAEMRRARDKLNEELERTWGVRIQARTGVNTGEVVAGDAAGGQRFATGDTMNVAARLEQAAAPGEILIGEETFHLVRDAVRVDAVEPLTLKGKADPVPAYQLVDVDLWAAGYTRRLDSPLVGRHRELEQLRASASGLTGATLTTVLGAAGLGKSRLTHEFLSTLDGFRVLRGRCLSYGEGVSFWPVMEIVHAAAEITEADAPHAARAKLDVLLADEPLAAERVAAAIGLGEGSGSAEETFWGVRKLLETLAADQPVALLIDDCHWAASAMLDLIEYVTGWSGAAPIMLLCLARPELLEARPSWPASVILEPLPGPESEQLLANLLADETMATDVRQRILETAEGNPLFIEQLVALVREGGEQVAIPPTIHALVAARLDRLGIDERSTIERGAIEGKIFHRGAVQHLTPEQSRPQVSALLLTLARKDLIGPDESVFIGDDAYRFRNLVVRDAAYEAMPKQARAELHERFVEWLESIVGERSTEIEEIVAHHLEQAHRYLAELGPIDEHGRTLRSRAGELYVAAGKRAMARGDIAAARYLFEHAASSYETEDPRRLRILPEYGVALREGGALAESEAVFTEAAERAARDGDVQTEAYALIERATLRLMTNPEGQDEAALELAQKLLPKLDDLRDDLGLAKAWRLLAMVQWTRAQGKATAEALERAIVHAAKADARAEEMDSLAWLALTHCYGPTPVTEARAKIEDVRRRAGDDPSVVATAQAAEGALRGMTGEFDDARALVRSAIATYRDLGMEMIAHGLFQTLGGIELLAGDAKAAESAFRQGYDALAAVGERGYLSGFAVMLGEALYLQERYEEAERLAREAQDLGATNDAMSQAGGRVLEGKIRARAGDADAAETLAREAVALVVDSDFIDLRADTHLGVAELLGHAGKTELAAPELEKALALYEQKGNTVAAARVRARLAEPASIES